MLVLSKHDAGDAYLGGRFIVAREICLQQYMGFVLRVQESCTESTWLVYWEYMGLVLEPTIRDEGAEAAKLPEI